MGREDNFTYLICKLIFITRKYARCQQECFFFLLECKIWINFSEALLEVLIIERECKHFQNQLVTFWRGVKNFLVAWQKCIFFKVVTNRRKIYRIYRYYQGLFSFSFPLIFTAFFLLFFIFFAEVTIRIFQQASIVHQFCQVCQGQVCQRWMGKNLMMIF